MKKVKISLSIFFFILGIISAILTYSFSNRVSYGHLSPSVTWGEPASGVDSSDDGVATGLGIIAGFSFLSSALLISSIKNKGE